VAALRILKSHDGTLFFFDFERHLVGFYLPFGTRALDGWLGVAMHRLARWERKFRLLGWRGYLGKENGNMMAYIGLGGILIFCTATLCFSLCDRDAIISDLGDWCGHQYVDLLGSL
jgi:hypothetical protein